MTLGYILNESLGTQAIRSLALTLYRNRAIVAYSGKRLQGSERERPLWAMQAVNRTT